MRVPFEPIAVCRTTSEINDFDLYADCFTRGAWPLELRQLDRGKFHAKIIKQTVGPLQVNHVKVNRRLKVGGRMPTVGMTCGIPITMSEEGSWMRRPFSVGSVQAYASGCEFEAVTPAGFETAWLSVLPIGSGGAKGVSDLRFLSDGDASQGLLCDPKHRIHLLATLANFLNDSKDLQPGEMPADFIRDCVDELADVFCDIRELNAGQVEEPKYGGWVRQQVLKRAEAYIESSGYTVLSVRELRQHTGASKSTLERAFVEHYGVLPKTYLMARRLNGVRKLLKDADPKVETVSNLARRWGFWHMGQFAADYQRFFGELPSSVLEKPRHNRYVIGSI